MTTALIRYDAAINALAECKAVDEVKAWADKAAAMQAYGRMAKDKSLEVDAAEIRIRAERRLGEMIGSQKAGPGLHKGGNPNFSTARDQREVATLADSGISADLSSRAQKVAAVPPEQFENEIKEWRGRVTKEGARVSARLQAAGAKALKEAPDLSALNDAFDDSDVLADLQSQVAQLTEQVKAVSADDPRAEALKWRQAHQSAERRISELMRTVEQREKHIQFLSKQLKRCGKAVGQEDIDQIAPAVEAAARTTRRAA